MRRVVDASGCEHYVNPDQVAFVSSVSNGYQGVRSAVSFVGRMDRLFFTQSADVVAGDLDVG